MRSAWLERARDRAVKDGSSCYWCGGEPLSGKVHHGDCMQQQQPTDTSHPSSRTSRRRRRLHALTVVHPVPSALNAVLVAVVALIAGGERSEAAQLAIAMLGFQFSIGALNDLADVDADRVVKPRKPIPAGLVPIELAVGIVIVGALVGLGISAGFGAVVLMLGALGYASGVAYDVGLRRLGLGWLCFAVAVPVMLAWTWLGAAGTLPPGWQPAASAAP